MKRAWEHKAIFASFIANLLIATTKFIAAGVTGSSALLSEAVHSVVDTGDEILLFIGIFRARKAPDELHPFGYGQELYFWSFIVAILVFAMGGGISVYEGIHHIRHPEPMKSPGWNYLVLAISLSFEIFSFVVAYKNFQRRKGFWEDIRSSKDSSLYTVLLEDIAAILGLVIAFLGVALSRALHKPELDGMASIGIGVLLVAVASILANESRNLLIGESLRPEVIRDIQDILCRERNVEEVFEILSMHFAPRDALVNVRLRFREDMPRKELTETVNRLVSQVCKAHPEVRRVFFASESLENGLAKGA